MANPVDSVLSAYADGASIYEIEPGNVWRARDRAGRLIVREAETLGEAARLYCEAKSAPARTLESEYGRLADLPEFANGWDSYRAGRLAICNPHTAGTDAADAWAAGWRAAAAYERAVEAAKQGGR